jgi:SAM-dependent methyltransferase
MALNPSELEKAAERGEPSYVWRAGQDRRLRLIQDAARNRIRGRILDDGCGVGQYLTHMATDAGSAYGLEFDFARAIAARDRLAREESRSVGSTQGVLPQQERSGVVCGDGKHLPFPDGSFDLVLSHEVLEHVDDDRRALEEMCRVLQPPDPARGMDGGRIILFVPNRGYPFETHGVYWRGEYRFGNIPLVNYLPNRWRDRLAPHVRAYRRIDLSRLFEGLPVRIVERRIIFGAYDNIIARNPPIGRLLRTVLQSLERTPLSVFGLSHLLVAERTLSDQAPEHNDV